PYLHDLGECEVKHGLRLHLFNLYKDDLGNPEVPEKLQRRKWKQASGAVHPINAPRWPRTVLMVALLVSAIALVTSSLIFFHRTPPSPTIPALPERKATNPLAAIPETSIAV